MNHDRPQEQPAVRTTIVGGRPPGPGKALGAIPRATEVLIKKAAIDAEFRRLLLAERSGAAASIGLALDPAEAAMLDAVPPAQLDAIIAATRVRPEHRPALLGKVAALMLAALGIAQAGCDDRVSLGIRPERMPRDPATTRATGAATASETRPAPPVVAIGARVEIVEEPTAILGIRPAIPPTTAPAPPATTGPSAPEPIEVAGARATRPPATAPKPEQVVPRAGVRPEVIKGVRIDRDPNGNRQ